MKPLLDHLPTCELKNRYLELVIDEAVHTATTKIHNEISHT